jgi:hypothetical protein
MVPDPVAAPPVTVQPAPSARPAPTLVQPPPSVPSLTVPQRVQQAVTLVPSAPVRNKRDVMEDLLKNIELPPNVPQFGDLAPSKPPERKRPIQTKVEVPQVRPPSELDQALRKLQVPQMAPPTSPMESSKEPAKPMPMPPKVSSLAEEMERDLKELKPIQAPPTVKLPEQARDATPMFRPPRVHQPAVQQQPSQVSASAPKTQKVPETKLKVLSGSSSGANAYLALVQRAINEKWTAPPVDISGTALTVVIKFRLSRSGVISAVEFKQQSGNGWYDDAGRRAVLSVERLPPFPPNITEASYDIYFTFAVGEGAG